jgi:hypothetical protein
MKVTSKMMFVAGALLALTSIPAAVSAQGTDTTVFRNSNTGPRVTLDKEQKELYGGIIPGSRDELKHLDGANRRYNMLQWIGFEPQENRTRVFIKATPGIPYDMNRSEDGTQITLTFDNTVVENYNLMRFIDTSYYKRSVKRIEAKRKRKVVTVTLTVEPGAQPNVDQTGDYIYFDFPYSGEESE